MHNHRDFTSPDSRYPQNPDRPSIGRFADRRTRTAVWKGQASTVAVIGFWFMVIAWATVAGGLLDPPTAWSQTPAPPVNDQTQGDVENETRGDAVTDDSDAPSPDMPDSPSPDMVDAPSPDMVVTPDGSVMSHEAMMAVPELAEQHNKAKANYEAAKTKLADLMVQMRHSHLTYRNEQDKTPENRKRYFELRTQVQSAIDETYTAALEYLKSGAKEESVPQYVITVLLHRFKHDIYDADTAEGAARMIDLGSPFLYLFQTAARSAVVTGKFDLARRLYEAIDKKDELPKADKGLMASLEYLEKNYQREQEAIRRDAAGSPLPRVEFETTAGRFVVELFLNDHPSTVSHFISLVEENFYDNRDFYQVIDNMLALTGDPAGDGTGNSGEFLIDENQGPDAPRHGMRGSVVMAKLPNPADPGTFYPNSGSSQFAILFLPTVNIRDNQTVFGRVVEGMDVVSRLQRIDPNKEKKKNEVQIPADQILRTRVLNRPEVLPTPEYLDVSRGR